MTFNTVTWSLSASALCVVLAGCGGGGSSPGDGAPTMLTVPEGLHKSDAPPVYALAGLAGLMERLLPGGDNTFPAVSTGIRRDFENGIVTAETSAVASIASDGNGGFHLILIVDGEEYPVHFASDGFMAYNDGDGGEFVIETDEGTFQLLERQGSFRTASKTSGSPYHAYFDILRLEHLGDDHIDSTIFFAFGARTTMEGIPRGSATYRGRMLAQARQADDPRASPTTKSYYDGHLTLLADFARSAVSGTVDRLESNADGEEEQPMPAGNRIVISGGTIVDGQFVAAWTGEGPEGGQLETMRGFTGNLIGEFFGPGAEEVAGVMSGEREATTGRPAQIFAAHFQGDSAGDGPFATVGPTPGSLPPVYAQGDGRTVVESADTAFGPTAITRFRDYRDVKQRIKEPFDRYRSAHVKSIAPDGAGGYRVVYVIDGREEEIHFDALDSDGEQEVGQFNINEWEVRIADYFKMASVGFDPCAPDDSCGGINAWTVFGLETSPEQLRSLGSAAYLGWFYADVAPPDGALSRNWRFIDGDLTLEADFGAGSVSGQIDSMRMRESEVESADGNPQWADMPASNSIAISNGRISDSRFRADWTGMDTDASSDLDKSMRDFEGEMAGSFFGPDGERVAGSAGGGRSATASTREWIVQGSFAGTKQE